MLTTALLWELEVELRLLGPIFDRDVNVPLRHGQCS